MFFLRRNQVLLASFLCLLFSISILAGAARDRLHLDRTGTLLLEFMRPLQKGTRATVVWLREVRENYIALRGLRSENENLRRRVVELEAERNRLLEAQVTNQRLAGLLDLRSHLPAGAVTATIIGNSASTWSRSLTIDKGMKQGVRKGMAVVSPLGAVGHIVAVASGSAKVLLITDPNSAVDVIDQRSRAQGIVSGSLDNEPILKYVKRSEDIQAGDRLITSGLDGIFPKGIFVGTVDQVRKKSYGLFQYVKITLAVDPSRVEEVLVVSAAVAPTRD